MTSDSIKLYLKNPSKLVVRLGKNSFLRLISDERYLKLAYHANMGKKLNLDDPQTFNEKLQWLKLYDRNPIYTTMVDKYEAKNFVAGIIGEQYIIPTYGVWDSFDQIDFDALPDQFVLKCTHDSGGLVICRDKNKLDKASAKERIEKSLKRNYYWSSREWPYKNVKPRIIAEQYMEADNAQKCGTTSLTDYKFFCFNGGLKLLYVSRGLENHTTAQISFYDMDGNELPFYRSDYAPYHSANMPENFLEMKTTAKELAKNILSDFVRIDLYSISGNVFFSEITFFPCGGMIPFEPKEWDYTLGSWIKLKK